MTAGRRRVLDAYADGVSALERASAAIGDWSMPTPCADWRAVDLAGHLLAIARYYHRLLDAADAGHPLQGLPRGDRLAAMNAADLRALGSSSGPARIAAFADAARAYGRRLATDEWSTVLGSWEGVGARTVAAHTGLAVVEWHVHAWDLATAAGQGHRPADPVAVASGHMTPGLVDGEDDPWRAVLAASGRTAGWHADGTVAHGP